MPVTRRSSTQCPQCGATIASKSKPHRCKARQLRPKKAARCKDCGSAMDLTEGEELYYKSKGLEHPKRCRRCRERRKQPEVKAQMQSDLLRLWEKREVKCPACKIWTDASHIRKHIEQCVQWREGKVCCAICGLGVKKHILFDHLGFHFKDGSSADREGWFAIRPIVPAPYRPRTPSHEEYKPARGGFSWRGSGRSSGGRHRSS